MTRPEEIDWTDPSALITEHFSIYEALWLDKWGRLATEADGLTHQVKLNIIGHAQRMELVRAFFGRQVLIGSWFRPVAYNSLKKIGGRAGSQHLFGRATDGIVFGLSCDEVRIRCASELDQWHLCIEDMPGAVWVHWDSRLVVPATGRLFKP